MRNRTPKRPDYIAGYIDKNTQEKYNNVGGGWIAEGGRIRVKLDVVLPTGQVVVLFPNQFKDAPPKTKATTITRCDQCGSTDPCSCNQPPVLGDGNEPDGVPYVYHHDCEGV